MLYFLPKGKCPFTGIANHLRKKLKTMHFIKIILLSAFCGLCEGLLLQQSGTTGPKIIMAHFSLYHVVLLFFLLTFGLRKENKWWFTLYSTVNYLPGIIIIQDFFSYIVPDKNGEVFHGLWSHWPLDSLWWGVPYFYWLCLAAQITLIILYYGLERLSR